MMGYIHINCNTCVQSYVCILRAFDRKFSLNFSRRRGEAVYSNLSFRASSKRLSLHLVHNIQSIRTSKVNKISTTKYNHIHPEVTLSPSAV